MRKSYNIQEIKTNKNIKNLRTPKNNSMGGAEETEKDEIYGCKNEKSEIEKDIRNFKI